MPHQETNDNETYDFVATDGQEDGAYVENGSAVTDAANVTVEEDEPEEPIELNASVENDTLTLENPSNASVTATVEPEDGENQTIDVPAGETATESFDPGNYTVTAESDDNRSVLIDGDEAFEFTVEEEQPESIDLDVTVQDQNLTVANPSDAVVTVSATDADVSVTVEPGETVTETVSVTFDEAGTYEISASGTAAGMLTVTEAGDGDDTPGGAEPPEDGGGLPFVAIGVVVVFAGGAGAFYFFWVR
jgi:hypothetical protein